MLLSVERHVVDGLQSLTVFALFTPLVSPMYCVRLLWPVLVSVQSEKYKHCEANEFRYCMLPFEKPRPTPGHVRFSNEKITTCEYFAGGAAVESQMPAQPPLPPLPRRPQWAEQVEQVS